MKTNHLFRLSKKIILSIVIAVLTTSGLSTLQSVKAFGSSIPQQKTLLLGECSVSTSNQLTSALNNSSCTSISAQPGDYQNAGKLSIKRDGVTLQCTVQRGCLTRAIESVEGNNNTVRGFKITDSTANAGIRVYGDNNLIESNEIYQTNQDGIWFFGSNNIYRNNYIHDIWVGGSFDQHVDCFQTWDWNWDTVGNLFENNICDHNRTSGSNQIFMVEGNRLQDTTIRNNRLIMHDSGYSPIALWGGSTFHIENNYICNTTGQGNEAVYVSGGSNVAITGNVYAGYTNLMRGQATTSSNVRVSLPCEVSSDPASSPPEQTNTTEPTPKNTVEAEPTNTTEPTTTTTPELPAHQSSVSSGLSWEAEQGEITAPFVEENGIIRQSNLTTNPANGGRALYRFIIQDAGDYAIQATVNAADAGSNSFFIGMDSEPDTSMIWDIVITDGFEERTVSWRESAAPEGNAASPKIFSLASGEHTLIIRGREANTQLDKVEVMGTKVPSLPTATNIPLPTVTQLPTETATPISPTLTSTPLIQITNSPSLTGLSWEAEQGEITSPFAVENGIVSQSVLTDNPVNGGRALYQFTIQDAGDYLVKAIVDAADAGRNSFFVGMDSEPDTSMIWDITPTNGFEERVVSWRGNATPDENASTPKIFQLSPGEHTLIIRGRENGTLLDKVELAKAVIRQSTNTAVLTVTPLPTHTPPTTSAITEMPRVSTSQPTNTAIPTVTFEASTPNPIAYTSTPVPTETPLLTYTEQPLDAVPPTITNVTNTNYTQWLVTFSEDIGVTGSNSANFSLVGVRSGQVVIDSINYDNNLYTTTLNFNSGNPLPPDDYTLLVAGTTSIADLAGNKLDGNSDGIGGDDFVQSFSIQASISTLTETPVPASPTPTATSVPPTATETATPVPPLEVVYDDKGSAFVYSDGWEDKYNRWAYKGSAKETTKDGSSVTLNFTGQTFSVLYTSGKEYREMNVYVDEVLVGTINERGWGWRQTYQQRWNYPDQLAPGSHTLKLVFVTSDKRNRTRGSLDAVIVR